VLTGNGSTCLCIIPSTSTTNSQDGSTGSSRRGSGRPATNGTAARPAASQRKGLAQGRRPARVATPEDDDDLPDEEEEEGDDDEGSFVEEGGQKKKKGKGLAAEVFFSLVDVGLTRRI
jgi:hypothetical protein